MNARSIERQVEKLLRELTVAEKVRLCHAVSKFSSGGVERLGIPCLTMSDGPHGVREEISADSWDAVGGDEDYSTYLPTGTALAATWNVERAREFGEVLGSEARERGKDVILGPGVNMVRSRILQRRPLPRRNSRRLRHRRHPVAGDGRVRQTFCTQQPGAAPARRRRPLQRTHAARTLSARLRNGGQGRSYHDDHGRLQ